METKKKNILSLTAIFLSLALLIGGIVISEFSWTWFKHADASGAYRTAVKVTECQPETQEMSLDSDKFKTDRSLMLINTEYRLPDGFVPCIEEYKTTTVYMDSQMIAHYAELSAAVFAKFNKKLYVSSDFRSAEEQAALYSDDPTTATEVGASEHQSGLALDVYTAGYAGDGFIKSPVGRFIGTECWRYGFIIRYPSYGEAQTGIRYEPWHIRYVGEPHAKIIYNNGLTLEEYILGMEPGTWYSTEGYVYGRVSEKDGMIEVPDGYDTYTVSPDNTGYYIVTAYK